MEILYFTISSHFILFKSRFDFDATIKSQNAPLNIFKYSTPLQLKPNRNNGFAVFFAMTSRDWNYFPFLFSQNHSRLQFNP